MQQDKSGQTRLSFLKQEFARFKFYPARRLGQNFLLDTNQALKICADAQLEAGDLVLEIGPGSGLLTQIMAQSKAMILGVEIDRRLSKIIRRQLGDCKNVEIIEADILAGKHKLNSDVLKRLAELQAQQNRQTLKCISNLPYNIATPFMANLAQNELAWEQAFFMLQYEVAQRLCAVPASRSYGSLSVVAALSMREVSLLRKIPPQVFWPRPRVDSAIVSLKFLPAETRKKIPWRRLTELTRVVFCARRKKLTNALAPAFATLDKQELMAMLVALDIDPELRADCLEPEMFLQLSRIEA